MQIEEYCKQGISYLFEKSVKTFTNKIALIDECGTLTYGELNSYVNKVANILIQFEDWKSGIVVAVDLPKTRDTIILILAIYKARGIFLPINSDCPPKRASYMIQTGQAQVLISDKQSRINELVEELNKDNISITCMLISEINKMLTETSNELEIYLELPRLAYIIHTSGTTGVPKGIMISQSSVINEVTSCYLRFFELDENWSIDEIYENRKNFYRIGVLADFSFDPSVVQMFIALFFGHCVVPIPDQIKRSQGELSNYLRNLKVDMFDITPTHCKHILNYFKYGKEDIYLPKIMVSVGEPLSGEMLNDIFTESNGLVEKVINAYGPSEVCVYSNAKVYHKEEKDCLGRLSVGKMLRGYQVYIMDQNYQIVEPNSEGEIIIASKYLADGYIGREDLSKQSFIVDESKGIGRFYKSNDIGIMDETGEVICLGRNDDQIKIRGHRIELGEIESVIRKNFTFDEVHVIATDTIAGKEIYLFYKGDFVEEGKIINKISYYLPEYMIPKRIFQVENFNVNLNGKLETKELIKQYVTLDQYIPREENSLLDICMNILKNDKITMEDNFFALGVDSLTVFELNARIYYKFRISINIQILYQQKTIRDMQMLINDLINHKDEKKKTDISTQEIRIRATNFQEQLIRKEIKYYRNQEKFNLQLELPPYNVIHMIDCSFYIYVDRLKDVVNSLIERNRICRSTFVRYGEEIYLQTRKEKFDCVDFVKVKDMDNLDWKKWIKHIRYTQLPLFQIILFESESKQQKIVINIHHGIFDYLSLSIFVKELFSEYFHLELPTVTEDFFSIIKNNKLILKEDIKQFWKKYLEGRGPSQTFLTDVNTSYIRTHLQDKFYCIKEVLPFNEYVELSQLCNKNKVSLFTFTTTILAKVLSEDVLDNDILLGTILHGRDFEVPHMAEIIGLFAQLMPLRIKFNEKLSVKENVIKQQLLLNEILKHQGLSLNDLYLMQSFNERIIGDYFKVIINYHTDFEYILPKGKGEVKSREVGAFSKDVPVYVQVRESKEQMEFYFQFDDSFYHKNNARRIVNRYFDILKEWQTQMK